MSLMSLEFYTICKIVEVDLNSTKIKISSISDMSIKIDNKTYNVFVRFMEEDGSQKSQNYGVGTIIVSNQYIILNESKNKEGSQEEGQEGGQEEDQEFYKLLKQQVLEAFHRSEKVKLYTDKDLTIKNLVLLKNNE